MLSLKSTCGCLCAAAKPRGSSICCYISTWCCQTEAPRALHKLLGMGPGQSPLTALQEPQHASTGLISGGPCSCSAAGFAMKLLTLTLLEALVGFHKCLRDGGTLDPHTSYQESTGEPGTVKRHALHNFCSGLDASEGSR